MEIIPAATVAVLLFFVVYVLLGYALLKVWEVCNYITQWWRKNDGKKQ